MGAGASAGMDVPSASGCAGIAAPRHCGGISPLGHGSPPGIIMKKRQYPKHARHLYKKPCVQSTADGTVHVAAPDTESTVMVPWPQVESISLVPWPQDETHILEVNDSEDIPINMVEEEDCSTSAPNSPRSDLSSVVEILDIPDLLD